MQEVGVQEVRRWDPPAFVARAGRWPTVLLVALGAFMGFMLIQYFLETARFHAQYLSFANTYGLPAARGLESPLRANLVISAANFLGVSIGALALVTRGRRWMFALPALCAIFLPWIANRLGVLSAYPLGQGWQNTPGLLWGAERFWMGASVDLGLALVPAAVLLASERFPQTAQGRFPDVDMELKVASIAFCLYVLAIDVWVGSMLGQPVAWQDGYALWAIVVPTCLFGILMGLRHPRWLALLVLIPLLSWWELALYATNGGLHLWPSLGQAKQALPLVGLTLLLAAWEPLSYGLAQLRRSKVALLVILNSLNIADAFLTAFAIRSEQAVEANALIRVIGLPGKVLLVALASWLLVRIRPRALIWPTLGLAAVLVLASRWLRHQLAAGCWVSVRQSSDAG